MRKLFICLLILIACVYIGFAQGKITRPHSLSQPTTADGYIDGHSYVDLGLPSGIKWATCNMGASKPYDFGKYYAWGELLPKDSFYSDGTFKGVYPDLIKKRVYPSIGSNSIGGNSKFDAATAHWGSSWRMPSVKDFEELNKYCTWKYSTINDNNGYIVTGPNGKNIFLPMASGICGTDNFRLNERAVYRTSDCKNSTVLRGSENWQSVCFTLEKDDSFGSHRKLETYPETNGFSIRPVIK